MRILAVVAHPDDMEILCAGTMALLSSLGHTVMSLSLAGGELGAVDMTLEESLRNRLCEAEASSAIIGAEFRNAGIGDKYIFFTPEIRNQVCEIFRELRPDLIFTHSPKDYIFDHEHTSMLARDAATAATARLFQTGVAQPAPAIARIPYFYYCAPTHCVDVDGRPVHSTIHVDISTVIETKVAMIKCYKSQCAWMKDRFGVDDFAGQVRQWAAETGRITGLAYAEGFRQHLSPPFPKENILAQLLGAKEVGLEEQTGR